MTDVNARAVRLAKKNLALNRVTNAEVRYGFFYEPVEDLKFNCVLSNPPVSAGMETVKAIVTGAPKVMAPEASFQMVIRSKIGAKILPALFTETFGNCEDCCARKRFSSTHGQAVMISKSYTAMVLCRSSFSSV